MQNKRTAPDCGVQLSLQGTFGNSTFTFRTNFSGNITVAICDRQAVDETIIREGDLDYGNEANLPSEEIR